ncbi:MAG: hypothetical protein HUJ68_10950 [Clostridia bacterium]|mgnify:CR=1 FL=1|nr:hypothetical protein [Clostridia bacterium]
MEALKPEDIDIIFDYFKFKDFIDFLQKKFSLDTSDTIGYYHVLVEGYLIDMFDKILISHDRLYRAYAEDLSDYLLKLDSEGIYDILSEKKIIPSVHDTILKTEMNWI